MKRQLFFLYGVANHAMFLAVYAWMALFVGNFGFGLIPTIDGPRQGSVWAAIGVDVLLVLMFGLQHSVMARPAFKRWWTQYVPAVIERSTYVLVSNVLMIVLLLCWQPVGGVVWDVTTPWARWTLWALFAAGWVGVPAVSFLINHFDLFGTRQVWFYLRGKEAPALKFGTPLAYRVVRHPLYVGWMTAFWATPTMTWTHLVFAVTLSAYILAAIPFEERDLVKHHPEYADYRRRVGGLIPRPSTLAAVETRAVAAVSSSPAQA